MASGRTFGWGIYSGGMTRILTLPTMARNEAGSLEQSIVRKHLAEDKEVRRSGLCKFDPVPIAFE